MQIALLPQKESFSFFETRVATYISKYKYRSICEIGAGSNPVLSEVFVKKHNLTYILYDKFQSELDKRTTPFKSVAVDFSSTSFTIKDKYDLVISRWVLEHIEQPDSFHTNVRSILKTDGVAIHFYTTLYALPTIANLILPEKVAFFILKKLQKRDFELDSKFPAYYRKCYGPRKKSIIYFQEMGFSVLEYFGFPGHHYFWRNPVTRFLEVQYNYFLLKLNSPLFTTSAVLIIQK